MSECELCKQGDPSINVRCWLCRKTFHLHRRQLDMAEEGSIILGDCPNCKAINVWEKSRGRVVYSGAHAYLEGPVLDLRGRR